MRALFKTHPATASRRFSASLLPLLLLVTPAMAFSCSSDEKKTPEQTGPTVRPVDPPCDNELDGQCGDSCIDDEQCPGGQFCSDGSCTAECTGVGDQCMGTCTNRGRCNGTLKTEVTAPLDIDEDDIIVPGGGAGGNAGGTGGTSCATGVSSAAIANVNMFIMFDQSSSMEQNDRWNNATRALVAFLQSPESADLKIALRFFASDEPAAGCNISECNVQACSQPLINLGTLTSATGAADAHEQQLVTAIQSRSPNPQGPGTPISAALDGAVTWATAFNDSAPETEKAVVLFVTDGEPSGCIQDTPGIAAIAAEGYDAGVPTYVVGLEGSNTNQLNQIAQRGGTGSAIFVGDGNAEQDLLEALSEIRGRALACDFPLPEGENVDPNKINVTFTDNGTENQWTKVNTAGDCGTTAGWYFDDNANPRGVILCPAACEVAGSSTEGQLEVILGCQTNAPVTR